MFFSELFCCSSRRPRANEVPIKVAVINSWASGHFNPARRVLEAIAKEKGFIHYFTQVEKQATILKQLCLNNVQIHDLFPAEAVDGKSWFAPDAPSNAGWYNAGIQAWEFGKHSSEEAQRTVKWLQWLSSYIRALKVDVIIGEMHAPWGKVIAKSLDLPYVTMCPMRLWNVGECLGQICSEMDGDPRSCWYNPVYEYVRDQLDTDPACRADSKEHHRRLSQKLEDVLRETDLYRLVQEEFGMTLTYSDKSWCDPQLCMFMGGYSSFNIQFTGEVFAQQPPESEAWFSKVTVYPVGPFIQTGAPQGDADPEVAAILTAVEQSNDETPIVYVALGTIDSDNVPLFRKVVSELCTNELPYLVIVRCGAQTSPEELLASAERRSNCFITNKFLPQQEILSRTSIFLTHCGMGSLNEALAFGVPCLLFPTDIERYGNAVIMDKHGIGRFLLREIKESSFHSPLNEWWQGECAKLDGDSIAATVADLIAASRTKSCSDTLANAKSSTVGERSMVRLKSAVQALLTLKGKTYTETEGKLPHAIEV